MVGVTVRQRGAVAFEFLLLFPFVVAILYAAAYYSLVFSWQYRMQNIVDRAVAEALYLDRSQVPDDELASTMRDRAQQRLVVMVPEGLPTSLAEAVDVDGACAVDEDGITVIRCSLALSREDVEEQLPSISFGFLGAFPPAPANGVTVNAQTAF